MGKRNAGRKIVSFILMMSMVITNFATSLAAAFADDLVDYEVDLRLTPDTENVEIGGQGTYTLYATAAQSEQLKDYFLKIALPADSIQYLQGFTEDSGSDMPLFETGQGSVFSSTSSPTLKLFVPTGGRKPYLFFTMKKGETYTTKVNFKMPEGTSSEYSIQMSENDFSAVYVTGSSLAGNFVRQTGNMNFKTHFDWNDVQKTVTPESVSVSAAGKMNQNIKYTVSADRSRPADALYIGMFTKYITITDTVTLPASATFTDGDVTIEGSGGTWNIKAGDTIAATVAQKGTGEDISVQVTDASISSDKKTLTFKYTQSTVYKDDPLAYVEEMTNPSFEVTLMGEGVTIDAEAVSGDQTIVNKADFEAVSWDETMKDQSSAQVSTKITEPVPGFAVKKDASTSYSEDGSMMVDYTIIVENTGAIPLNGLTITDNVPSNLEITDKGDANQSDNTLSWTVDLAVGGSVSKTFKAKVTEGVEDGTSIKNTATASYGDIIKNGEATITYKEPDPDLTLTKTAYNSFNTSVGASNSVYEGETIKYVIDAKYNGMASDAALASLVDQLPDEVEYVSAKAYLTSSPDAELGITYDEASHEVRLTDSASIASGQIIRLEITVKVKEGIVTDELLEPVVTNSATASLNNGAKADAQHTTLIRERTPLFKVTKNAERDSNGNINLVQLEEGGECSKYKASYTITLENTGDPYYEEDAGTITDTMSGGLQPALDVTQASGQITATAVKGDGQPVEITGTWVKDGEDNLGQQIYSISWNIPFSLSRGEKFDISYDAFVDMENFDEEDHLRGISLSNTASTYGSQSSDVVGDVKTVISASKVISQINGAAADDPDKSEIKTRDVIKYRLTVSNTGNRATILEINDLLPQGNVSHVWNDDNVTVEIISGKAIQSIQHTIYPPQAGATSYRLSWGEVPIEAGETIQIDVTLDFGQTVEEFRKSFGGIGQTENTLDVVYRDPYSETDSNGNKEWVDTVTHNPQFSEMTLSKTTDRDYPYRGGEDVIYTLSDFYVTTPKDSLYLTDDLSATNDYLDFKSVFTGQIAITSNSEEVSAYLLTVTATTPGGETVEKTIQDISASGETFTYEQLLARAGIEEGSVITKLRWDFGHPDKMEIIQPVTITMTAKDGITAKNIPNTAMVDYNGNMNKTAVAEIDIYPDDQLVKTAHTQSGELPQTSDDSLKPGDTVSFNIQYRNYSDAAEDLSERVFTDYMSVKGVEPGDYDVTFVLYDSQGEKIKEETLAGAYKVTEYDINSETAKKASFTAPNGFSLSPVTEGDGKARLEITYSVKLSDAFKDSTADFNKDKNENWGITEDKTISDSPENMYMLHNRVVTVKGDDSYMDETGYYYHEGSNKLMIRKSILGYTNLMGFSATGPGAAFCSTGIGSTTGVRNYEFDTVNTTSDLLYWPAQTSSANFIPSIRYGMIVANDKNSKENLVIDRIEDVLPNEAWKGKIGNYNLSTGNYVQLLNKSVITEAGWSGNNYAGQSLISFKSGILNVTTQTLNDESHLFGYAMEIPESYDFKGYNLSLQSANTKTPVFDFNNYGTSDNLVLRPGECAVIVYCVPINRTADEPEKYTNTATLYVQEGTYTEEFQAMEDLSGFKSKINEENERAGVKHNDGTFEKIDENVFTTQVDSYPSSVSAGIAKDVAARISPANNQKWDENTTISQIAGGTRDTNVSSLEFNDIAEFEITVTNSSANVPLTDYTLKDLLPYPYEIITEDVGGKTVVAKTSDGKNLYGTVEDTVSPGEGDVSQTITIDYDVQNIGEKPENHPMYIAGKGTKVIKVYARYTGNEKKSLDYINRVEFYPDVTNNFVLNSGEAIYDKNEKLIGGGANATIHPSYSFGSGSVLAIDSNEQHATGNDTPNTVEADFAGDKVLYTMRVTNDSTSAYENLVLINRLPAIGDKGVVNAKMSKKSQFGVDLASDEENQYLKNGLIAEYQIVDIGEEPSDDAWLSADNLISVTSAEKSDGYSSDVDWSGAASDEWTTFNNSQGRTNALRFVLPEGLPGGKQILVRFTGIIDDDADPGEIAYDAFGYAFTSDNSRYYAEPAKVGVEIGQTKISGTKIWDDENNILRPSPENTPIILYKSVNGSEPEQVPDANITWINTDGNEWTFEFTGLRKTEEGQPITYTVSEGNIPGYTPSVADNGDGTFTVTNTLVNTIDLDGTKTWRDDQYTTRPESIDLKLMSRIEATAGAGDYPEEYTDVQNAPQPVWSNTDSDIWSYSFEGLPAETSDGKAIQYKVVEMPVEGYESTDDGNGNFTNTASAVTEISVIKQWQDNNDQMQMRPDFITVKLLADGVAVPGTEVQLTETGGTPGLAEGISITYGSWSATFAGLDKFNSEGHLISYTIEETGVGLGYDSDVNKTVDQQGNTSFTITNTMKNTGATIGGTKTLSGKELQDDQFTFQLYDITGQQEQLVDTVQNKDGAFAFDQLIFDAAGTHYYKVVEQAGSDGGITYDSSIYYFKVSVTESGDNTLSSSVSYAVKENALSSPPQEDEYSPFSGSEMTFENTYSAEGKFTLQGQKTLSGKDLTASQFSFKLEYLDSQTGAPEGTELTAVNGQNGSISFPEITLNEAGTSYYRISETAGGDESIQYDDTVYDIKVTATDNGAGALETEIFYAVHSDGKQIADQDYKPYTAQSLTFTNVYDEETVTFELAKEFTGEEAPALTEGQFEFILEGGNLQSPVTARNAADGKIVFSGFETYNQPGTYEYTVKEVIPGSDDPAYDSSITYDSGTIKITVNVTRNEDGTLTSDVTYVKEGGEESADNKTFTNIYTKPGTTRANITVTKEFKNADGTPHAITAGQFSFTLTAQDNAPMPLSGTTDGSKTVTSKAASNGINTISFGNIYYDTKGTYTYVITETEGSDPSVSYDKNSITVTVEVTKGENNDLKAEVTYNKAGETGETSAPKFENTYTMPDPTQAQFEVTKEYTGADLKGDDFEFVLKNSEGEEIDRVKNDAAGKVTFDPVEFNEDVGTAGKTYTYTISEVKGSDSSVTYDENDITVTVNVTKDEYNNLNAEVSYNKAGSGDTQTPSFTNTYTKPGNGTADISVTKVFKNADGTPHAITAGQFSFTLTGQNGAPMPAGSVGNSKTVDSTISGSGTEAIDFGSISYDTEDTYTYVITETKGNDTSVTYDSGSITVTVKVTKDQHNNLQTEVTYSKEGADVTQNPKFTNTYTAPDSANAQFEVTKEYTGADLKGDDFEFVLKNSEGEEIDRVKNNAAGKVTFDPVEFNEDVGTAGKTYTYTISEVKGDNPSVTYDEKDITVTVNVTKDEYNNLKAEVSYNKAGSGDTQTPSFTNTYTIPEKTQEAFEVSKTYNKELEGNDFEFVLKNSEGEEIDRVKNDAAGKVTFDPVEFNEDVGTAGKTYTYTINEVKGDNSSITYDEAVITVTVKVTKNAENRLAADVTYEKAGEVTENPSFNNTYDTPGQTKAVLNVSKHYADTEGEEVVFGENVFSFEIAAEDNAPLPDQTIISTTEAGVSLEKLSFGEITYTEDVGDGKTYTYTIREVIPEKGEDDMWNPSVSYGDEVIKAEVTIIKDDDNNLQLDKIEYFTEEGAKIEADPTIENTYTKPDPVDAELNISKSYVDGLGEKVVFGENVFSFEIAAEDNAPLPEKTVISTTDTGAALEKLTFDPISFTEDVGFEGKTYTYTIREIIPMQGEDDMWNPSVTYGDEVIKAEVTIIKDDNNDLQVDKIEYFTEEGTKIESDPTIENTYTAPDPVDAELNISKHYKDAGGNEVVFGENVFTFEIAAEDGAPLPAETTVSTGDAGASLEKLTFDPVTFNEDVGFNGKTYTYTIREVIPEKGTDDMWNPSVTYGDEVIKAEVTIIKDDNNDLQVESIKYFTEDGTEITEDPTIENTYTKPDPVDVVLNISKHYKDAEGNEVVFGENTFSFEIAAEDGAPLPENTVITTTDGAASFEKMSFGAITYTEDVGFEGKTYTYTIREIIPVQGEDDMWNPSVTYGDDVITAKVTIIKDENNDLKVDKIEYFTEDGTPIEADPTIENIYTRPESTQVVLSGVKDYEGTELKGGDFEFILRDKEGNEIEKVTNDKDGNILFSPLIFDEDSGFNGKTYEYTITETDMGYASITYDSRVTYVTVNITKDENNALQAEVKFTREGEEQEGIVFENVYTSPEPAEVSFHAKKEYKRGILKGEDFSFVLKDEEGNILQTVKNDKDGNIDFESIIFNEDVDDKTYTYTISEINEGEEYVSYDERQVTVKVRVIKNEENVLTAEVTYVTEEGETDEPVFVNINTRLPKTGDSTNMLMYLLLMSISGGAAIVTGRKKKAESMR